jgi:hypothetical protein
MPLMLPLTPRPQRTACRCIAQDFHSAADVSQVVLEIILGADRNQMSTESLLHVAAALNLTVSGSRNLRFKIRALIRNTLNSITSSVNYSSASVADFFNSFESHRRPVLVSIAALHRIDVPTDATIEVIRTKITEHIISGRCAQFANMELPTSRPKNLLLPDCTDVCHEWQFNGIDPDLQVHILSALYGSKHTNNLIPSETCVKTEDGELVDFTSGNARTLARLQSSSARLISAGTTPTSATRSTRSTRRSTRSPPRRARNRPPQTSTPMDVDATALRYQKRSCPSEGPDTQEHLTKRKRR